MRWHKLLSLSLVVVLVGETGQFSSLSAKAPISSYPSTNWTATEALNLPSLEFLRSADPQSKAAAARWAAGFALTAAGMAGSLASFFHGSTVAPFASSAYLTAVLMGVTTLFWNGPVLSELLAAAHHGAETIPGRSSLTEILSGLSFMTDSNGHSNGTNGNGKTKPSRGWFDPNIHLKRYDPAQAPDLKESKRRGKTFYLHLIRLLNVMELLKVMPSAQIHYNVVKIYSKRHLLLKISIPKDTVLREDMPLLQEDDDLRYSYKIMEWDRESGEAYIQVWEQSGNRQPIVQEGFLRTAPLDVPLDKEIEFYTGVLKNLASSEYATTGLLALDQVLGLKALTPSPGPLKPAAPGQDGAQYASEQIAENPTEVFFLGAPPK